MSLCTFHPYLEDLVKRSILMSTQQVYIWAALTRPSRKLGFPHTSEIYINGYTKSQVLIVTPLVYYNVNCLNIILVSCTRYCELQQYIIVTAMLCKRHNTKILRNIFQRLKLTLNCYIGNNKRIAVGMGNHFFHDYTMYIVMCDIAVNWWDGLWYFYCKLF